MVDEASYDFQTIEFGIFLQEGEENFPFLIPADYALKEIFSEMLTQTMSDWIDCGESSKLYDPSENYASNERLEIALSHDLASVIKAFYDLDNITTDTSKIRYIAKLFFYFCIFRRRDGTKLIAIKKAVQFKGLAKQKMARFLNDSLQYVEDTFFKIDKEFDFIITSDKVLILHPKSFESFANLDEIILQKATENTARIGETLSFIDVSRIEEYTKTHKRAARLIASIIYRSDLINTSEELFRAHCERCGVEIEMINGKISPAERNEIGFLNVLDRRRYAIQLVEGVVEKYEAPSRHSV